MIFFLLILKNLRRNPLRVTLTCLATMVLVFVVTMIWTVVAFLDNITREQTKDLRAIVTERWQVPSQMPWSYAQPLSEGAAAGPEDVRPQDHMTWQFYIGTLDPEKRTRENFVFLIALDPHKLRTLMDDLGDLDPALVEKLLHNKQGVLMGRGRLQAINKQVGDRFRLTSLNYKGIDLEFEIVGPLLARRYDETTLMNRDYLNDAIDSYKGPSGGRHPLDRRRLNLVWLRVADPEEFSRVAQQIESSSLFTQPAVKCETMASFASGLLDIYSGLLGFIQWVLVPACMFSMTLIIANAISISVRERRTEMAVLKVLGFRPWQILVLVLGEAFLVGAGSGLLASGLTYAVANSVFGGIKFPNSPPFPVPVEALVWGLAIGTGTALLGSILPAWSARTVKVAEVFAKVA